MKTPLRNVATAFGVMCITMANAQKSNLVKVIKDPKQNKVDILVNDQPFTSFLYPDTLEKPVLYPVRTINGTDITRGFPLNPQAGDPTDHPHHIGIWFNFENVNGLDFWNNSYAIPKEKKSQYGWVKTDKITQATSGPKGVLAYHANWTNQNNDVLLEENTKFEFTAVGTKRMIDRVTTLKAKQNVVFTDAKDGMLAIRVAHALQIPTNQDQKFTDDKGIVTVVKAGTDKIANGNYVSSEGKTGDDVWSTRASWCEMFGKMGNDSISIAIMDHPSNPNYPTYWHARGYGLFAANPLGEKIFTNGKTAKNLTLKPGESTTFRYRIVVDAALKTPDPTELNKLAAEFAKTK